MRSLGDDLPSGIATGPRVIEVPVTYGGEAGPDLDGGRGSRRRFRVDCDLAACGTELPRLHAGLCRRDLLIWRPWTRASHSPRRDVPRERVPAGSVAIAAGQTGIYPTESPGGWHLIGRTALQPFDVSRAEPCLFRVGDEVRFQPVEC